MDSLHSSPITDPALNPRVSLCKIWKEIEEVKEEMRVVVEQINKAQESLKRLRIAEQDLLDVAMATASLMYPGPFQNPPPEIIGEIAAYLLIPVDRRPCISSTKQGIWPLTHVCHSWRNSIVSFPQLWSSFTVAAIRKPRLELLSTFLERSGEHPLSIGLSLYPPCGAPISSIISLVVQHARRWKKIDINAEVGPTPFLPLRGQLSRLEKLELRLSELPEDEATDNDPWFDSVEERGIFEYAPKLTELLIEAVPHSNRNTLVRLKFPFHQLKKMHHVDWDSEPLEDAPLIVLDDLAAFSNVSYLYLGGYNESLVTSPITLHTVTHLGLRNGVSVLASLRLPSLTSLELTDTAFDEEDHDIVETFLTIHSESFANWALSTLVVRGGCPGSYFIDLLSHDTLHELHTLTCKYIQISEAEEEWRIMMDILSILIWVSPTLMRPPPRTLTEWGSTNILPRLRTLVLECFSTTPFKFDAYAFTLIRGVVISRTTRLDEAEMIHENGHTTDHGIDEVDNPSSEYTNNPTRLEHFSIKYHPEVPALTMSNLNDILQAKFIVTP